MCEDGCVTRVMLEGGQVSTLRKPRWKLLMRRRIEISSLLGRGCDKYLLLM